MSATDSTTADASLADLKAEIKAELRDEFEDELERKNERIDELEERIEELEEGRETAARERAELCGRVYELEECQTQPDSGASNPTPDTEEPASATPNQPETPLEQIVGLPEHLADDQLTANQRRARFVASDVKDYAESVPAGWSITSADLRRILRAADESAHAQTVKRVMGMLDDLGGDDVEMVKRRGVRRVVFADDLVERLDRRRTDHDVVSTAEV